MQVRKKPFLINAAAVFRGELRVVESLKEELKNRSDIELIFFTTSGSKLFVIPENKMGGKGR